MYKRRLLILGLMAGTCTLIPQQAFASSRLYDYVANEITENKSEEIDIQRFHIKAGNSGNSYTSSFQTKFKFKHPEYFYAEVSINGWNPWSGENVSVGVKYTVGKNKIKAMSRKYNAALNRIVKKARKYSSKRKQVEVVNREICKICAYDYSGNYKHNGDAYGCLVSGKSVCEGYALGAAACYNKLGIANTFAYSRKLNHVWNKVKIKGRWYHVDSCWNDTSGKTKAYLLKGKH